MATLQNTNVPDNGYYRVGTSTNTAYVSAGGPYAVFGNDAYMTAGTMTGTGEFIKISSTIIEFVTQVSGGVTALSISTATITLASPTTTIALAAGNTTTNSTLGVGAAAGTAAADGKILVSAGGTGTPALEVTNCLGDGSTSTATKSVFKGFLGVKIGLFVGPVTAVVAGTRYIRLWGT